MKRLAIDVATALLALASALVCVMLAWVVLGATP